MFDGQLSQSSLNEIPPRLLSFKGKLPSEFARQPRSFNELDWCWATELRSFLIYTGPIALKGVSDHKHFLSLPLSIKILSDDNEMKHVFLVLASQLFCLQQ